MIRLIPLLFICVPLNTFHEADTAKHKNQKMPHFVCKDKYEVASGVFYCRLEWEVEYSVEKFILGRAGGRVIVPEFMLIF